MTILSNEEVLNISTRLLSSEMPLRSELYSLCNTTEALRRHRDVMKSIITEIGDLLGVNRSIDGHSYVIAVKALMAEQKMLYYQIMESQRDEAVARAEAAEAALQTAPQHAHFNILAEALAEIKATVDGQSARPVRDIVYGCLAEIAALAPPQPKT